jgi:hypothetical protein
MPALPLPELQLAFLLTQAQQLLLPPLPLLLWSDYQPHQQQLVLAPDAAAAAC